VNEKPASAAPGDGRERDLVAGVLRGYRTWHIDAGGLPRRPGTLPLTSITRQHVAWPPELRAECTRAEGDIASGERRGHRAPDARCACGIYAWYRPDDAAEYAAEVFGVVDAAGVVLMGTRGFRAERARIRAVVTRNRRLTAACRDAGIEVFRRRRVLLAQYPPDDVTALVGPLDAPARRPFHAFGLVIGLSVWFRALVVLCAVGLLPATLVVGGLLVSEAAVLALALRYVRG